MTRRGVYINKVEPIRSLEKIREIKEYLLENESPRNYLLFVLGVNFALRISDLLLLKVKDVRSEDGKILSLFYIRESKTNKEKTISINRAAKDALSFYFKNTNTQQTDWLFPSKTNDCHVNRSWCWKLIQQWIREVRLEGRFGTHSLRKTFGYQARMQGISIELIQAKFNHSSPAVTRRYIGITGDEITKMEQEVNI